ncbi:hypothetical protein MKW98_003544 [Papaver atlanticum]|uniref:Uncharacterized protein n=1 Tax=Papaver atlanticum TaxID=357466 RepID=A0AAD4TC40_9MAGN|nr:hypothetical protein MKW98_003544 [Papaver atlanticum]
MLIQLPNKNIDNLATGDSSYASLRKLRITIGIFLKIWLYKNLLKDMARLNCEYFICFLKPQHWRRKH